MSIDFEWPIPPHFEVVAKPDVDSGAASAACVVFTREGERKVGELVRLDPDALLCEFHPEQAARNATVGFARLQSLRLTQYIELRPVALSNVTERIGRTPTSSQQKCTIRFKDGTSLVTETIGFVLRTFGLFLYPVIYGNHVQRWFVPGESIESYQIGDKLGKLLMDENIVSNEVLRAGLDRQEKLRAQKLGEYLESNNIATKEQVEGALLAQKRLPQIRLGEALVHSEIITRQQLADALQMQSQDRKKPLGDILVEMNVVNRDTVKRVLAQKLGIPFVALANFQCDLNLVKTVSGDLVRKYAMMPLYRSESRIVVAMENPLSFDALKEMEFATKLKVDPVMASPEDLNAVIARFYGSPVSRTNIAELVSELDTVTDTTDESGFNQLITDSDNTLVRLVNEMIMDAFETGASDIHIESMGGNRPTRVRVRKDGVLSHYSDIPANFRNALVSRIKIMSRLDISERRRSQDGKISFEQSGAAKVELRVVTMPTANGLEDVVMRILTSPKAIAMDGLGLSPQILAGLKKVVAHQHGLLLVCGPTGSGKTTTLHALLGHINTPERKIWTVEDPIEITQDGLRQVQVQARIDWTFANVLRSFLRADPDVIMVGEARDPETARIVVEASLTGHLVFSTLHTNSAVESVIRLLDLGLDPFNFADALLGVVGQRLARRLCTACRVACQAPEEEIEMLAQEYCFETGLEPATVLARWRSRYADASGAVTLHRAGGCDRCKNSGYQGRLGIHELLLNSAAIKKKIHTRASVEEMQAVAMAEGMSTLRQDGIEKILQGHTDWEQIKPI